MTIRRFIATRSRGWKALAVVCVVAACVLAFVPLFNLVGYESAAFYGVLLGLVAPFLAFDDLTVDGWARACAQRLALAVVPFAILSANALFVQNCAYLVGVQFWALIVVGSVVIATTLGWFVRCAEPKRPRLWIALLIAASIAEFAARLALDPPITGHHVFLGYFSGSIYDEALAVPASLVWYRATHVALVAALVAAVHARQRRSRAPAAIALALAVLGGAMFLNRQRFGVDIGRTQIERALGGVAETEHFLIYYPQSMPPTEVARLVEDHEFRYAEMAAYFETDPVALRDRKVKSFVYANRDQKGALMGGRRTLVAKIWLHEMHILWRHYGDHMLAHELAHVFTEPFARGPLRLSTRFWIFPNMGIVEGAATAADWDADNLDPHVASAALRRLGRAPDIASLVGASGFWRQSSGRAYTLMGSFIRWLVDEYGIEKFRRAYGDGDFDRVYGVPSEQLVAQWGAFVDALPLEQRQVDLARYYYDRRSIFEKVCARTIAELRREVEVRRNARDDTAARALMDEIVRFDPTNVGYLIERAELLLALNDTAAARAQLDAVLKLDLDAAYRARANALLADVQWAAGDLDAARDRYATCLEAAVPLDAERLLHVKHRALLSGGEAEQLAFQYLVDTQTPRDIAVYFPTQWVAQRPDDPLGAYLLGRRLWGARQWSLAIPHLERATTLDRAVLADEAQLMLLQSLHFGGDAIGAAQRVAQWAPASPPYVAAKEEWTRRLDWHRGWNTVDGNRR